MTGRDSVVSPDEGIDSPGERTIERSLRPVTMDEFVGQMRMREQLEIFIGAARNRSEPLDHVLVFGPTRIRQDHTGSYHCPRDGRQSSPDFWACAGKGR